jgi:predicted site-specific integrase-resolvase
MASSPSPFGLTAAEIATRLGKHPITLYRWALAGIGPPSVKIVGRRYWPEADFERWLREQRTPEPAEADS